MSDGYWDGMATVLIVQDPEGNTLSVRADAGVVVTLLVLLGLWVVLHRTRSRPE